jgi:SAM-dependent methyltransferase
MEPNEPESHVVAHYGDDYFEGGGAGYSDYVSEGHLLRNHGRRYGKMLARKLGAGTVLDVGSAAGFLLQGLVDTGWSGKGVEPNGKMAAYARNALGLDVFQGPFESFRAERGFDLVTMVQVIAHFLNPMETVRQAARLLKPGGSLFVESWNRNSWTAKLFGKNWHEYSPPTVLHWFDIKGMRTMGEKAGLSVQAWGRPIKWLDGAHAKSLFHHVLGGTAGALALPIVRLLPDGMPIPYPSEDLFWMLLRKDA